MVLKNIKKSMVALVFWDKFQRKSLGTPLVDIQRLKS